MSFESAVQQLETTNANLVKEVVRVRDAIMGLNRVYPTVSEGRNAVETGDYFTVPGGNVFMTLYRKTGSTSQDTIAEYPSQSSFNSAITDINDTLNTLENQMAQTYRFDNILGTVSQSGGEPTGAIIERGSNDDGEYARFADGTQICGVSMEVATDENGDLYQTINMPRNFFSTAGLSGSVTGGFESVHGGSFSSRLSLLDSLQGSVDTSTRWRIRTNTSVSPNISLNIRLFATGRWY